MLNKPLTMRPSRVLDRYRAGEVVSCWKTNLSDARAVEIAAMLGFDCVWTCVEHVGNDWTAVEQAVWAAKGYDTDVMVRVGRGSYSDHVRALELDASGILVPHVMSLQDAKWVVRMTRFHPIGRRPVDSGNADGAYCNIPMLDYMRQANAQRFVALQIEDPEPLADLEAIADLEGVDMLFFGPSDFSQGIGAPGQANHPELLEARRRVAEVCQRYGKMAGTVASFDNVRQIIDLGYRFINVGADVLAISRYCKDVLAALAAATRA